MKYKDEMLACNIFSLNVNLIILMIQNPEDFYNKLSQTAFKTTINFSNIIVNWF